MKSPSLALVLTLLYGGAITAQTTRTYCGTLQAVSGDNSELQLATGTDGARTSTQESVTCASAPAMAAIEVQDKTLKDSLGNWKPGDRVVVTVAISTNGSTETATLQDMQSQLVQVAPWGPALVLVPLALILFLALLSQNVSKLLFRGQDGRLSNSKTQVSLWFILWISAYAATFILRWMGRDHFLGNIATPTNLLALSGLSGLTFAGAQGITANKAAAYRAAHPQAANGDALPGGKRNNSQAPAALGDLIKDDAGNFDFGDFQMLVMVLIALVSYSIILYHFLGTMEARVSISLPDVDGTVLAAFGVGQGAYLTKKAATGIDQ